MKVSQLPYLNAVSQETLRMYPVLPIIFPRITKSPVQSVGRWFEAGTKLFPTSYLVHYREDLYPNAQQFKPERFLERQYSAFEYFPIWGQKSVLFGLCLSPVRNEVSSRNDPISVSASFSRESARDDATSRIYDRFTKRRSDGNAWKTVKDF